MLEILWLYDSIISKINLVVGYLGEIGKDSFEMTVLVIEDSSVEACKGLLIVFECGVIFSLIELYIFDVLHSIDKGDPYFEFEGLD